MPNHYHLLLYLKEKEGVEHLMRSVMTAYSRYFNTRYDRFGTLFESHFLASRITSDEYLFHVSQYIHLNPLDIKHTPATYNFSSVGYFVGEKKAEWLHPEHIVESSAEKEQYRSALVEGSAYHELLHQIKHELANASLYR